MVWIDIAILVVVGISATFSLIRGFVREALSLAGWIAAVIAGIYLSGPAAPMLTDIISNQNLRLIVAFVLLFVATLFAAAIANFFICKLVKITGLSGTDRMIGVVFGVLRGVVVVSALVVVASMTTLPTESWWQESLLLEYFEQFALWAKGYLPSGIAQYIHYK